MSRVTIDGPTGALRIGGKKVFPLGLSNAPPLGATTPGGKNGLKEVADGGITFIRTGRGNWGPGQLDQQIAAERAMLDAAAATRPPVLALPRRGAQPAGARGRAAGVGP